MIKTYIKVATIKAEQFDGSDEMVKKYPIEKMSIFGADHIEFHILTLNGWVILDVGDWIVADDSEKYQVIDDDNFKKSCTEVK